MHQKQRNIQITCLFTHCKKLHSSQAQSRRFSLSKEWADTHHPWRIPLSAHQRKSLALAGFWGVFPGRCTQGIGRRSIPLTLQQQQQQPGVGLQQLLPVGCLHCLLLPSESTGRLRNGQNASVFPGKLTSLPIHWCQTPCWKPEVSFCH